MSPRNATVHVGYEVGTGAPVSLPMRNLAVTGQTQESGKTTTLEALAKRSGATTLTFVTKRGESSFESGRRIPPYFRDRADWQFVTSIIDATLQEKNKFLRPWIMKICRTTQTLKEVQAEVRRALKKAKGISEGVYTQLDAYLELIVPEIERAELAPTLDLAPGLSVMDVSSFATPMQMLFVQSALDWVNDQLRETIVVIPEAWEFIPEQKGSPVKNSAETLVRKGSGIGNHIWVDSQDMAGVDKTILRGCPVWLIGVQREANEIKRNLSNIPANIGKPKPADVAMLERGQFFVCFGRAVRKVYVQPAWMEPGEAIAIARGNARIEDAVRKDPIKPAIADPLTNFAQRGLAAQTGVNEAIAAAKGEDEVDKATADALTAENARLKEESAGAEQRGYERGMSAALRQASEFWNAATLDMRDKAQELATASEHLAGVARDGGWCVPSNIRRSATPVETSAAAPAPAAGATRESDQPSGEPAAERPPGVPSFALIDVLVRSHPLPLTAELWGAFAGKSPTSGWWRGQMKILREAGLVRQEGGRYAATPEALEQSSAVPANPRTEAELWKLWRDVIRAQVGGSELALLSVLYAHRPYRLTAEQWSLLAEKSSTSGWWRGAQKKLRDWDLLESSGSNTYAVTDKGAAVLGDVPKSQEPTAEVLRLARRAAMPQGAQTLYDRLADGDDRKALAKRVGWSDTSGHWRASIKGLLESGLVIDDGGRLHRVDEELVTA